MKEMNIFDEIRKFDEFRKLCPVERSIRAFIGKTESSLPHLVSDQQVVNFVEYSPLYPALMAALGEIS